MQVECTANFLLWKIALFALLIGCLQWKEFYPQGEGSEMQAMQEMDMAAFFQMQAAAGRIDASCELLSQLMRVLIKTSFGSRGDVIALWGDGRGAASIAEFPVVAASCSWSNVYYIYIWIMPMTCKYVHHIYIYTHTHSRECAHLEKSIQYFQLLGTYNSCTLVAPADFC